MPFAVDQAMKLRILDEVPIMISLHDVENNILWANKAYLKAANCSQEDLSHKKCYSVRGLSRPCSECPALSSIQTGEPAEAQLSIDNQAEEPERQACWHVNMLPLKDDDGKVFGVIESAYEITDQKIALEQLRNKEEKFRALFEQSGGYCMILDPNTSDGIPVIVEANRAACLMHGYERDEFIGRPVADIDDEEGKLLVKERTREIMTGKPFYCENRHIRKDGTFFDVAVNAKRIDIGNDPPLILTTEYDITERKQAALEKNNLVNRLNQAEKMEAIGTLAGGIAHDFNNILGAILGYTELAKADAPPQTQLDRDLDQVLIAANRAKTLVQQILSFSHQSRTKRIPLNIEPFIKEGLKMLRASIPSTIEIIQDIDPACGAILADPTQTQQILINLCTNAYHAMEMTGGQLTVGLKRTFIGPGEREHLLLKTLGEHVELTVSDTGQGIPPDIIDKIFDPYFTTKESGKGTGMGLAIIHGIVSDYDGAITVQNEIGKGTTFHVYFPVVEKESLPETTEPAYIPRGTERVLFIDDEELLTEMAKNMLQRLGYRVTVQNSSPKALALFENAPDEYDIVITDQTMPGMTGSELARRMIEIRPAIPIILCTGYSTLMDEASATSIGIKEFLMKPIAYATLARLIRSVLDA